MDKDKAHSKKGNEVIVIYKYIHEERHKLVEIENQQKNNFDPAHISIVLAVFCSILNRTQFLGVSF